MKMPKNFNDNLSNNHLFMKHLFFVLVVSFLLFTSCKNEEIIKEKQVDKIEIKTKTLSFGDISIMAESLRKLNIVEIKANALSVKQSNEEEIQQIILPLIENGNQIHKELIDKLIGTFEWNSLPESEKSEILNMSDTQKAQVALFYITYPLNSTDHQYKATAISNEEALHCLSAAVGLTAIETIISGSAALTTVETTVALLKVMGKRYLGYIGLALAIYEFVECVSQN